MVYHAVSLKAIFAQVGLLSLDHSLAYSPSEISGDVNYHEDVY